jgi:hypothetical protein
MQHVASGISDCTFLNLFETHFGGTSKFSAVFCDSQKYEPDGNYDTLPAHNFLCMTCGYKS